jgi:alkyl hydroperoxide reductase subunit AhpC
MKVAQEMKISFPILSDPTRNLIRQYNVLHPQEGIARPALFLVNKEGQIVWKYIGMDASDRPSLAEIFKQLQAAK